MLTKALALEWGPRGITVNAVGPTFVHTPGTAERLDTPEFRDGVLKQIPLGRVASMTDVAATGLGSTDRRVAPPPDGDGSLVGAANQDQVTDHWFRSIMIT